jgi:hypothetical protein
MPQEAPKEEAMPRTVVLLLAFMVYTVRSAAAPVPGWTPGSWVTEDTLDLTTDRPDEGAYTFPVWLVVVDDQVYVRLGGRAADRVQQSKSAPHVGVAIAGKRFERVRCEPAPDQAPRVAEAIGQKYTSDILIRYLPHPLTCRLVPE